MEEEETVPVPEYTDDELNKLLLYIQQIATSYDLTEEEISESYIDNATKWLMDVLETTLFVYFDQGYLCASAACPTNPVTQMTYLIRDDPGHVFSIDGFHDEISFGTMHENCEETVLALINNIYAPLILKDKRWDENARMRFFNELHSFMAHLTDVNSKIGSMVVLYVPKEGHELTVEEAVLDKALVKRYENVIIYWISQIRLCLNDMDNKVYGLACPADEYDFFVYKCEFLNYSSFSFLIISISTVEVLSGIEEQIRQKNIEHILNILQKSQSLFIVKFKELNKELNKEIERSRSNARYLMLLVEPCMELEASEYPKDVPPKLPKIIYLIRVISLNSEYYKIKKNTERLFSYLSNEIINYCKSKVDIPKILSGHPRFGIKICDMSIDCCLAYKQIFRRLLERLQTEDFRKSWVFDDSKIFNQIDIFITRLTDIMEIAETIIVFGRCDETVTIPPLTFGCSNAKEFTMTCRDMEKKFDDGLKEIKAHSHMILDVHNKDWYQEMSNYKKLIRSLEEVVQNLLVNVFININNVEEALDVLTAMHNFSKRKSLQGEYVQKVEEMWSMFEQELISANKDITRLDKEHLDCLPPYAGKSMVLNIKMKKVERLKDLLMSAHYLPKVPVAEAKLKMYEMSMDNIRAKIEEYNNEWSSRIIAQPMNYLTRFLINRSPTHGGLLECNIDRSIIPVFEEAKYFDMIERALPSVLIQTYPKAKRIINIFNKVVNVILLHNRILCSLSDKERLLFKEHIKAMDRKLSPGIFRLNWENELTSDYITDCIKHLDDLQHFVDVYKIINMRIVRLFEEISNGTVLNLNIKSIGTLTQFRKKFNESRNASVTNIGRIYRRIIEYIIVIYEGFESSLTNDIGDKWVNYILKMDALAEYALLNCAKNTIIGVFNLLHGKNNMSPEPIISCDIVLNDRQIEFEPSRGSITSTLKNIYPGILKSLSMFPRLIDKFELKAIPGTRSFQSVIEGDEDCKSFLSHIHDVIQENVDKTSDYIYSWHHFRPLWDIDMDRFMTRYQEKGLELKEFESSMMKYFDVANQVMMQDTVVTITYLTFNCSRLKDAVLEFIAGWKKSYKQTLCAATLKKLEQHNVKLTSRITKLNEHPSNYEEMEAALKLHAQSMDEMSEREAEMAGIREFYSFLGKMRKSTDY